MPAYAYARFVPRTFASSRWNRSEFGLPVLQLGPVFPERKCFTTRVRCLTLSHWHWLLLEAETKGSVGLDLVWAVSEFVDFHSGHGCMHTNLSQGTHRWNRFALDVWIWNWNRWSLRCFKHWYVFGARRTNGVVTCWSFDFFNRSSRRVDCLGVDVSYMHSGHHVMLGRSWIFNRQ